MSAAARPRLSLCMIVRDEAARLPACLDAVGDLADELVVVDTGSRDATRELARARGARVIETTWTGDFAAARNLGLAEARGRWILVLDADEILPVASRERLRALVSAPPDQAYNLVQKNQAGPRTGVGGGGAGVGAGAGAGMAGGSVAHVNVHIVRLFPNDPRVRFERPIHEQVNTSLERAGIRIVDTDIVFDHAGYADPRALVAKTERNRRIIEEALARDPDGDPNLRYFHASTFFDQERYAEAAAGYADCAERCAAARPRLARVAGIKAGQAWFLAGDFAASAAALDAAETAARATSETALAELRGHPLVAHLRAELAIRAGQAPEAERWQEALLAAPDRAYLPPEPLAPLKFKALLFLAEHQAKRGRKDLGLRVLLLAQEVGAGKRDGAADTLAAAYRAAVGR